MENKKTGIIIGLIFLILMSSCQSQKQILDRLDVIQGQLYAKEINTVSKINFAKSEYVLIDVRDVRDYNAGHIPKALSMDLNSSDFAAKVVTLDPKKNYYIYGKNKTQAQMGRDAFKLAGIPKVFSFANGLDEYTGKLVDGTEPEEEILEFYILDGIEIE